MQQTLFDGDALLEKDSVKNSRTTEKLKRLDLDSELRDKITPYCRLGYGDVWEDPVRGHKVGVLDAAKIEDVNALAGNEKAKLIINDPPYNVVVGNANTVGLSKTSIENYIF